MNNVLLYIGGLFVAVLAALFAGPAMIDWNGYRGVFEEEASKVLGRDVRVGGTVNVRLLPSPYVRFERVRLADTTGHTGEPFIRAESFTMRLAGPPLLRGVLEAKEIEFDKPVLTLALDDAGGGNWQDVTLLPGSLPFVPRDVTLRSVRIVDGTVSMFRANAELVGRVEAVNGELSADTMRGPYRFQGKATVGGLERNIRFSTTRIEGNGNLQIKAVSDTPATGLSLNFDGRIDGLSDKPKLTGALSGRHPIEVPAEGAPAAEAAAGRNGSEQPAVEFKARLAGDSGHIAFDAVEFSLAHTAVPQVMTGTAKVAWAVQPEASISLSAKWFDLDRLAGAGDGSAPFARLKALALGLLSAVSGDGTARADLALEQVKLGGESTGGLHINAERRDGEIRIAELRAGLPGGSRLGLTGTVKDHNGTALFLGEGYVHGTSLARLKTWAEKSGASIDINADGPFSVSGQLLLSPTRFELTDASAEIAGQPLTGEVKIIDDDRYRAEITLESARLPDGVLFPETIAALEQELRKALGLTSEHTAGSTGAAGPVPLNAGSGGPSLASKVPDTRGSGIDINLRLLAGQMSHRGRTYTNVDAKIDLEDGDIRIPALRATTGNNLTIKAEGQLSDGAEAAIGLLAFDADAPDAAALGELAALIGIDETEGTKRISTWRHGRLAGAVRFGERAPRAADISVDGVLGSARVVLNAEFDDGLARWRLAPARVRLSADGASLEEFLAGFTPGQAVPFPVDDSQDSGRPARIQIGAAGILASDARVTGLIESAPLTVGFEGAAGWPEDQALALTGQAHVETDDLLNLLALAGVTPARGLAGTALSGDVLVSRNGEGWRFDAARVSVGSVSVAAAGSLTHSMGGEPVIDAEARVDRVVVSALLSSVLDAPRAAVSVDDGGVGPWPDGRFDFTTFATGRGRLTVKFDTLELDPKLVSGPGSMILNYGPGGVSMRELSAEAAGGTVRGEASLTKVPGGAELETRIALSGGQWTSFGPTGRGTFDFELAATGRGDGLLSVLNLAEGTGNVTLKETTANVPSTAVVADVIEAILSGEADNTPDGLLAGVQSGLGQSTVRFGSQTIPLAIADGRLKLAPAVAEHDKGRTTTEAVMELASLTALSTWYLQANPPKYEPEERPDGWSPRPSSRELPALLVRYRGPLHAIAEAEPELDGDNLQRELIVLQSERSAQELERLRLLDQQLGEREAERRELMRQEAERRRQDAREAARRAAEEATVERLPPVLPESYGSTDRSGADGGASSPAATAGDATVDEAAPPPPQVRPATAPRPAPRPRVRAEPRTTADEVMRSLGGFP